MNFFEHLDTEFAKSKEAFLYSIKRLPDSKIIVINVELSSLTYNTGFFNIRSLRNFIADVAELINSDSKKRIVIVVSDSIKNTEQQYFALQDVKKIKRICNTKTSKEFDQSNFGQENLATDSILYSALFSMVHSDIVNLFYDGFSSYNLRVIGLSIPQDGIEPIGELKKTIKRIESLMDKQSMSESQKIAAVKKLINTNRSTMQSKPSNGLDFIIKRTAGTIKGLFKAYPRTIPIIMEDISHKSSSSVDDDGFAAKVAVAINANVMISISKKGLLYTTDPLKNEKALPFYCYDTSRADPFPESRKKVLAKKLNAAKSINSHSRPIPMLLTSYDSPYKICNMFDFEKIKKIYMEGEFPRFTIFINTDKLLRFSTDISLPIEDRHIAGKICVDKNAAEALLEKSSLLSVGITSIEGDFNSKTTVIILDENFIELGRGVTKFSSEELKKKLESHSSVSVTVINRTKMRLNENYRRSEV